MNSKITQSASLFALMRSLWRNRQLIIRMVEREVIGRYKGSAIGLLWSFINPLVMLTVYTFVFSVVFQTRWATNDNVNKTEFAIILFVGMIVFNLFAEVINRAPNLILSNLNYVKKVVFPLEILPIVATGTALFHGAVNIMVLALVTFALNGSVPWTAVFTPFVLLPLIILVLGLAWSLASVGVYIRDVGQSIGILTTVLMFLSPIFYPISALPSEFRFWLMVNPLTFIIEQARDVLIWGRVPDWRSLLIYTMVSIVMAWGGYFWFQKTRKGFSDVM